MKRSDIETYRANRADRDLLSALHKLAFYEQGGDDWTPEAIDRLLALPDVQATIATKSGPDITEPLGFAIYRMVAGECEIISLGVAPEFRKRGAGSLLIEYLLADCRRSGVATVYLEVASDNPAGRRFYRRHGFIQSGGRQKYYLRQGGERIDAEVLSLRLDHPL